MIASETLHLFNWDKKFFSAFYAFLGEHIHDSHHRFIVYGDIEDNANIPRLEDIEVYPSVLKNALAISKAINKADKIILHGLFNGHLIYLLALHPWLLKKCYWVIWGGDLYVHELGKKTWKWKKNEVFRHIVIRKLGGLITYLAGDVALAREWYGAKGKYHECIMYPSNIFKPESLPITQVKLTSQVVLIGNSADPSNNHLEVFEKLTKLSDQNYKVICPLSYGNAKYAEHIAAQGKRLFGDRFVALLNFMSYPDYLKILSEIDIAIFNHKRQQAMGNIINLIGLGKKVYLRDDITPWRMFEQMGIKVFNVAEVNLQPIEEQYRVSNYAIVTKSFSTEVLIAQLNNLFKG